MATLRQLRRAPGGEERLGLSEVAKWMTAGNGRFPVVSSLFAGGKVEPIDPSNYAGQVYKSNGIVFACMEIRRSVFSEVVFRFAAVTDGKVGRLFGTPALGVLERPWPNGTTGELASRMIQDVDLTGNFYAVSDGRRLWRRDPAKMVIALDGDPDVDEYCGIGGYLYYPGGVQAGGRFITYLPDEVCHWSPIPDPQAEYRGMSWITPILREVQSDNAATDHKLTFFTNAATPNMVVKTPAEVMTEEQFEAFRGKLERDYTGAANAHKTLYLAPGADVTVVGRDLSQMDFSNTQGRDETRIAAAAGVPAVIVGLKESMQGSSLNAGNYGQARRRFADGTMRPLYRSAAAALETLVAAPTQYGPVRLWYDDSAVAFFRDDRADAADTFYKKMMTAESGVRAGYDPSSVAAAVEAEDLTLLQHTGLYSVQLQPPGAGEPASDTTE